MASGVVDVVSSRSTGNSSSCLQKKAANHLNKIVKNVPAEECKNLSMESQNRNHTKSRKRKTINFCTATHLYRELFKMLIEKLVGARMYAGLQGKNINTRSVKAVLDVLSQSAKSAIFVDDFQIEIPSSEVEKISQCCKEYDVNFIEFMSAFTQFLSDPSMKSEQPQFLSDPSMKSEQSQFSFFHRTEMEYLSADSFAKTLICSQSLPMRSFEDVHKFYEVLPFLVGILSAMNKLDENDSKIIEHLKNMQVPCGELNFFSKLITESTTCSKHGTPCKKRFCSLLCELMPRTIWKLDASTVLSGLHLLQHCPCINLFELIINLPLGCDPDKLPGLHERLTELRDAVRRRCLSFQVAVTFCIEKHYECEGSLSDSYLPCIMEWAKLVKFTGAISPKGVEHLTNFLSVNCLRLRITSSTTFNDFARKIFPKCTKLKQMDLILDFPMNVQLQLCRLKCSGARKPLVRLRLDRILRKDLRGVLHVIKSIRTESMGMFDWITIKSFDLDYNQNAYTIVEALKDHVYSKLAVSSGNQSIPPHAIKDKDSIFQWNGQCYSFPTKKRNRSVTMIKMEHLLSLWIDDCNQKAIPLSVNMIKEKALSLFSAVKENDKLSGVLGGTDEKFSASGGWFERYKNRLKIQNVASEAVNADREAALRCPDTLKKIIEEGGYSDKQIFNVGETGLFWKQMPFETFFSKRDNLIPGFKDSKDRLSLLLGGNVEGDFKLKPMVVNRSQNPKALKGCDLNSLPVIWRSHKTALVTKSLFEDWLTNYFSPVVEQYCQNNSLSNKVLLILDNAPGQSATLSNICENVKVIFLPPNTTLLLQPMAQGVIAAFKAYYLRKTFQQAILATTENTSLSLLDFWENFSIMDAIHAINDSWLEVSPSEMKGVWKNLLPQCANDDDDDSEEQIRTVVEEVIAIGKQLGFDEIDSTNVQGILKLNAVDLSNHDLMNMEQYLVYEQTDGEGFDVTPAAESANFQRLNSAQPTCEDVDFKQLVKSSNQCLQGHHAISEDKICDVSLEESAADQIIAARSANSADLEAECNDVASSQQNCSSSISNNPKELLSMIGKHLGTIKHEDEFDIVGRNVASKLRRMPTNVQLIAEKLINEILYEGLTNKLKSYTTLVTQEPALPTQNHYNDAQNHYQALQRQDPNSNGPVVPYVPPQTSSGSVVNSTFQFKQDV
ncbi:DDE superfamily endonuclease domain [Trinorchestia longiramus]|nr:DDE superfamily endonuclease domain [Trinorchestia longiramus]